MPEPDVSVIIPTYDRRHLLEEAIQSCFAGNASLDVEVVVVDDGSTDGTRAFLRVLSAEDPRVCPVFQEHGGAQRARNRGLKETRGETIKFLDSDDVLAAGALAEEVDALRRTESEVAYGGLRTVEHRGPGRPTEHATRNATSSDLISGIFRGEVTTNPPVFLYRRDVLTSVAWDPAISYHQDTAYAIAVASQLPKAVHVDRSVAAHRLHSGERISDFKTTVPHLEKCRLQVDLIGTGVAALRRHGQLREQHRQAAADGIWQWAHMVAAYDLAAFDEMYREVERVAPGYRPERSSSVLRVLDVLGSPDLTERVTHLLRLAKMKLSQCIKTS